MLKPVKRISSGTATLGITRTEYGRWQHQKIIADSDSDEQPSAGCHTVSTSCDARPAHQTVINSQPKAYSIVGLVQCNGAAFSVASD
jgi:hypothetical protein